MIFDFLKEILELDFVKRIIITIIIFVCAVLFIRIIKAVIAKSFKKMNSKRSETIQKLLQSVTKYVVWFFAIMVFMQLVLHIDPAALIATAGIAGVAIGFGAQSLVKDVITGAFSLFEDQCNVGDLVTIDGFTGTVLEMGFRTLKIKNYEGDVLYYPNGSIGKLINHSKFDRCVLVDIPVSYETDLHHAQEVLSEALADFFEQEETILELPVILGVTLRTECAVDAIRAIAKEVPEAIVGAGTVLNPQQLAEVTEAGAQFAVKRKILQIVKEAFDKSGIEIPYQKIVIYQTEKEG